MKALLLIACTVVVIRKFFSGYRIPSEKYAYLKKHEAVILESASEVLFPEGGDLSPSGVQAGILRYTDNYFGWHGKLNRTLMRLLLILLEHATIVFAPGMHRIHRMSELSPEIRLEYLSGWAKSDWYQRRLIFESLRAFMCFGYLGDATVEKEMGIFRPEECKEKAVVNQEASQ